MTKIDQGIEKKISSWMGVFAGLAVVGISFFIAFVGSGINEWVSTGNSSTLIEFAPGVTLFTVIPIVMIVLLNHKRKAYYFTPQPYNETRGLGPFPYPVTHCYHDYPDGKGGGYVENPSTCRLCQKHPVDKKYHLTKVHHTKTEYGDDYFFTCGCNICLGSYSSPSFIG